MGAAVAVAGVVLALSVAVAHDWKRIVPEPTPPEDIAAVRRGVAILERGRETLVGMQPCDGIKALLPDRFTREDGNANIKVRTGKDVIVCTVGTTVLLYDARCIA